METLSFTGKRWLDPIVHTPADPLALAAALRTQRDIGKDAWTWRERSTYPMAEIAMERVLHAAKAGETVGIIGDYDCDGLTSTAILVRLLRRQHIDPIVRLPHRLREGYGVRMQHIEEMRSCGVTLLLTTDTGIVAYDALAEAQKHGIDVIVLDHHAFTELPPAFAILHPALTALQSAPAAAGVTLSFAHVFAETWEDRETDLVLGMLGTIADVVPLKAENRTMVQEGLAALSRMPSDSPLGYLREQSGCGTVPTSIDIAFRLAPRLNAAGRMDDPAIGLAALLGDRTCADRLEALNGERQRTTQACMDEALASLDPASLPACIVTASKTFPKGIIGLIAGKLTEKFGRPTMAVSIEGDMCTASLRGVPGYDIAAGLQKHATLFTTFGGHAQAGGCSFLQRNLAAITEALVDDVRSSVDIDALRPTIAIDAQISLAHAALPFIRDLQTLEPFGNGNTEPLFLLPSATLTGTRTVGADQRHLQARVGQIGVIGFGLGHLSESLIEPVDLACRITANDWNGTRRVQLSVVDIRSAQTGANLPSISNTAMTGTFNAAAIL